MDWQFHHISCIVYILKCCLANSNSSCHHVKLKAVLTLMSAIQQEHLKLQKDWGSESCVLSQVRFTEAGVYWALELGYNWPMASNLWHLPPWPVNRGHWMSSSVLEVNSKPSHCLKLEWHIHASLKTVGEDFNPTRWWYRYFKMY